MSILGALRGLAPASMADQEEFRSRGGTPCGYSWRRSLTRWTRPRITARSGATRSGEVHALEHTVIDLDGRGDVGFIVQIGTDPAFGAGMDTKSLATELRSVQQSRQNTLLRYIGMLRSHDTPIMGAINARTGVAWSPPWAAGRPLRAGAALPVPLQPVRPHRRLHLLRSLELVGPYLDRIARVVWSRLQPGTGF